MHTPAGITILAGAYGSGKSEVAVNYALYMARNGRTPMLADLDLVNPYFAARDERVRLEAAGIQLLAPRPDLAYGDVPSLPPEIFGIINNRQNMVIDVAGDEFGALVLGYLSSHLIRRGDYEFWLVVNPYRPFAGDLESVTETRELIEGAARIACTGIVSNPNLLEATDEDVICRGHAAVCEYADALGLPIVMLTMEEKFYPQLETQAWLGQLFPLRLFLRPDWIAQDR